MKVISSNKFSKEEVVALKDFYEFLLQPFRFGKDEFKADIFRPDLLAAAIDMLSLSESVTVYGKVYGYGDKNRAAFEDAVRKLRSLRFRAIYDSNLISKIERAEDYSSYDPCVVLAYARMYDDFRLKNSEDKFNISLLSGIVNMTGNKKILELSYGLVDGKSYCIKDVATMVKRSVSDCKKGKESALQVLQQIYCY